MNFFQSLGKTLLPELEGLGAEELQILSAAAGSVASAYVANPTKATLVSAGGTAIGQVIAVQPTIGLALLQDLIAAVAPAPTAAPASPPA
jgi:hypothetical protein